MSQTSCLYIYTAVRAEPTWCLTAGVGVKPGPFLLSVSRLVNDTELLDRQLLCAKDTVV